jgi:hypothetical protein
MYLLNRANVYLFVESEDQPPWELACFVQTENARYSNDEADGRPFESTAEGVLARSKSDPREYRMFRSRREFLAAADEWKDQGSHNVSMVTSWEAAMRVIGK